MEYDIKYVKFQIYEGYNIITEGSCPTFFLNSLTDAFIDFSNSPYTLKVYYNDKLFSASVPK